MKPSLRIETQDKKKTYVCEIIDYPQVNAPRCVGLAVEDDVVHNFQPNVSRVSSLIESQSLCTNSVTDEVTGRRKNLFSNVFCTEKPALMMSSP